MKTNTQKLIIAGGYANLLMALFHIFLGYQIHSYYGNQQFYPLLQMFNIGGSLMVFFLAFSSILYPTDIIATKLGKLVIWLNILLYFSRSAGEFILFPSPSPMIIIICLSLAGLYLSILITLKKV